MKIDYLIKNGRVLDPSRGIDRIMDIAVKLDRIVETADDMEAGHVIDAKGCLVTPGFIDFHTHVFHEGSTIAIRPDLMVAQGTTAACDAGSAGTATYEAFHRQTENTAIRLKSFLTVYSGGQLDPKLVEDFDPGLFNVDKMKRLLDKYGSDIIGLKIRISKGIVEPEKAAAYLQAVVDLAEELGNGLRVCVHTTNAPVPSGELAEVLRKGDIFAHCYQGMGNPILTADGRVDPRILKARERGVIFDAANGKGNFGIETAVQAIKEGFLPDVISSDLTNDKFNMPPYAKNLPTILSKYLSIGMELPDVIRTVTAVPAALMGMAGQIGTLAAGSYADITISKLKNKKIVHQDFKDQEFAGDVLIVPQLTMCAGEIQFCQTDFWY